jgi:hypothetical protein
VVCRCLGGRADNSGHGGSAGAGRACCLRPSRSLVPPGCHPCRLQPLAYTLRLPCGDQSCGHIACAACGLAGANQHPRAARLDGGRNPFSPAASGGPRRGAGGCFRGRSLFLDCPSVPPIAAQSLAGSGLRPGGKPPCNRSRQRARDCALSSPCSGNARPRNPRCHALLLQPETLPAPCGALPPLRFVRRLRRAEPSRKGEQA